MCLYSFFYYWLIAYIIRYDLRKHKYHFNPFVCVKTCFMANGVIYFRESQEVTEKDVCSAAVGSRALYTFCSVHLIYGAAEL